MGILHVHVYSAKFSRHAYGRLLNLVPVSGYEYSYVAWHTKFSTAVREYSYRLNLVLVSAGTKFSMRSRAARNFILILGAKFSGIHLLLHRHAISLTLAMIASFDSSTVSWPPHLHGFLVSLQSRPLPF